MNKRRRTSSVASRGQDEESGETDAAPEPARKKKKLDPVSSTILFKGSPQPAKNLSGRWQANNLERCDIK
jgi:hypothetical protein